MRSPDFSELVNGNGFDPYVNLDLLAHLWQFYFCFTWKPISGKANRSKTLKKMLKNDVAFVINIIGEMIWQHFTFHNSLIFKYKNFIKSGNSILTACRFFIYKSRIHLELLKAIYIHSIPVEFGRGCCSGRRAMGPGAQIR